MSKGRFEELLFSGAGGLAPGGGTEEALRLNVRRHRWGSSMYSSEGVLFHSCATATNMYKRLLGSSSVA